MESEGSKELDIALANLRSALNRVRAPRNIRDSVRTRQEERNMKLQGPSRWLIPLGLAASLGIVVVGLNALRSPTEPKTFDAAFRPANGFLVARTQVPLQINSLSGGAELRYLDSHVIRDEFGLTRVMYIQLPEKD